MWLRILIYGSFLTIIGAYVAWPYYSLHTLQVALDAEDTETVDGLVDWPAVRAGLETDFAQRRMTSEPVDGADAAAGGIASRLVGMLAPAMTEMMVDAYATPQGLSRLLRTGSVVMEAEEKSLTAAQVSAREALEAVKGEGKATPIDAKDDASQLPPMLASAVSSAKGKFDQAKGFALDTYDSMSRQYDYVFFTGPRTFSAEFAPATKGQSEPLVMVLRLQNFQWQLVRVHLPG